MLKPNLLLSRLNSFLGWWLNGLLLALPEETRERIRPTPDNVLINFNEKQFVLKHYDIRKQQLVEERTFEQDDALEKTNVLKWLASLQDDDVRFVIEISNNKVLNKALSLPASAEANLEEILGFEMDRQTPFTPEKVYFDYVISKHESDNEKLQVELFVVQKNYVEPILEEVNSWGIKTHGLSVNNQFNINLLPRVLRPKPKRQLSPLTLSIAFGCLALFFAMLYVPVIQQEKALVELEKKLSDIRSQAKEVQVLIEERKNILTRTEFLKNKRSTETPVIELIKELTHILPDNTWINRLIIREKEIQLHGESNAATTIIQVIENSTFFEQAQFRSPVTQNNATQKDKFHVSAQLVKRKTEDADT